MTEKNEFEVGERLARIESKTDSVVKSLDEFKGGMGVRIERYEAMTYKSKSDIDGINIKIENLTKLCENFGRVTNKIGWFIVAAMLAAIFKVILK